MRRRRQCPLLVGCSPRKRLQQRLTKCPRRQEAAMSSGIDGARRSARHGSCCGRWFAKARLRPSWTGACGQVLLSPPVASAPPHRTLPDAPASVIFPQRALLRGATRFHEPVSPPWASCRRRMRGKALAGRRFGLIRTPSNSSYAAEFARRNGETQLRSYQPVRLINLQHRRAG